MQPAVKPQVVAPVAQQSVTPKQVNSTVATPTVPVTQKSVVMPSYSTKVQSPSSYSTKPSMSYKSTTSTTKK